MSVFIFPIIYLYSFLLCGPCITLLNILNALFPTKADTNWTVLFSHKIKHDMLLLGCGLQVDFGSFKVAIKLQNVNQVMILTYLFEAVH